MFWVCGIFPEAMTPRSTTYDIYLGLGLPTYEDRDRFTTTNERTAPEYKETTDNSAFRDIRRVEKDLRAIDWAFTRDDTGFLTHDIHPYPAKFIPQIPGNLIARLSRRGELVLDPFGGSGTTALEAVRTGRRALSIDANAIGTLIGKVKTCNVTKVVATDLHGIRCALTTQLQDLPQDPATLIDKHRKQIPEIPNREKWFAPTACGELALIQTYLAAMETEAARNIGRLALSRIILKVSFQDSETRYSSSPREVERGTTIRCYLETLEKIIRNVLQTQPAIRYGVANFITADSRSLSEETIATESIDLIVTSPPYGNAMDYHLYHRFRLLWLGYDPRALAHIEVGSHLRHQKESNGFETYMREMSAALGGMHRVLRPGRYAALVVGDSIYDNHLHDGAAAFKACAEAVGFETICTIERQIHRTKRSFITAGRRATTENIIVLRKSPRPLSVLLQAPPYRLWPYEARLRTREAFQLPNSRRNRGSRDLELEIDSWSLSDAKRLVFTHHLSQKPHLREPTWQAILENGFATQSSARKDSKYVTHGIHPYKGKFYPQLAKALINLSGVQPGALILDPFCGSGTTILEGYLNGFQTAGCDMHPLAATIARAKVAILDVNPDVLREAVITILRKLEAAESALQEEQEQFAADVQDEVADWFPRPVIHKLNMVLRVIRAVTAGVLRDFFEVILSSIIRDVSHQDPNDLRIRRRKTPLHDADVFGLFAEALDAQYNRIERFWSVRGYAPNRFFSCTVLQGDTREQTTLARVGATPESVDLILTSPPYATALPYIDTDRLSLLVLFGLNTTRRRPLEHGLVGSREIVTAEKRRWEAELHSKASQQLPNRVRRALQALDARVKQSDAGFRRQNMPALLMRFFTDMQVILQNCRVSLKKGGQAMIIIGDNRTTIGDKEIRIPTTDWIQEIAKSEHFDLVERLDISVTTENLVHIKNAIKENVVLWLRKP